jgi:amino acid transporter
MIVSAIAWAHTGSDVLRANWAERPASWHAILRDIFYGVCIGFLGVSGFETTPSYIELVSLDKYPSVIRNLICAVTLLNGPLILLVYAHIPSLEIKTGTNILSRLADKVAGRWLRTLLVVDAMLVLCGGIVTGLFTACGLLKRLAEDGVLPNFFLRQVPITKELLIAPIFFLLACIAMYASSGFNLTILSSIFSVTLLTVLLLVRDRSLYLTFAYTP